MENDQRVRYDFKKRIFSRNSLNKFLGRVHDKGSGLQRILNDHWYHQSFDSSKLRFVVLLNFFSFFYYIRVGIEQYLRSQINLLKMKPKMDWIGSFYRDCRAFVRVCEKVRHIENFSFPTIFWACFLDRVCIVMSTLKLKKFNLIGV